jgi:cytochrome P450
VAIALKQRLHWLALHGFVRGGSSIGARQGDLQSRLIADPTVKANPAPFYEEVRARGPLVRTRIGYITADHAIGHELLRSDDFRVLSIGSNLPAPLRWLEQRTRDDLLHPLRPPSLLAVEPPDHTRYRKTVSSVFTHRAVTGLRDGVEQTAEALLYRWRSSAISWACPRAIGSGFSSSANSPHPAWISDSPGRNTGG